MGTMGTKWTGGVKLVKVPAIVDVENSSTMAAMVFLMNFTQGLMGGVDAACIGRACRLGLGNILVRTATGRTLHRRTVRLIPDHAGCCCGTVTTDSQAVKFSTLSLAAAV